MKISFLGTGTSQGVPVIGCECDVCLSPNPKDKRLRTSILIESDSTSVVIDTGPDFRAQVLRINLKKLDGVVFTHEHKDHVAGLDDVRPFNFMSKQDLNIYAHERVQGALKNEFHYAFSDVKYPGVPQLQLNSITKEKSFMVGDLNFTPIEVMHHKLPVLGFRINNFTYITDANFISEEEKLKIKGTEILVLNALRKEKHISHYTLDEAIELMKEIKPKQGYLTHLSHLMGKHESISKELPKNISLAHDELCFEC